MFKYHEIKCKTKKIHYLLFSQRENSKLLCLLTFTQQLKVLIQTRNTDLVLHRIQQHLGLKQYTIPVNKSTPEGKRGDPLVRWYPQASTCVHLFLFHTRMCPVGFQDYLQTCEEDPSFSSLSGKYSILFLSQITPMEKLSENDIYMHIYIFFLTNTFARNSVFQIHKLNGLGQGEERGRQSLCCSDSEITGAPPKKQF